MAGFKFTKYGIAEDARGAQVKWTIRDRTYLADVIGVYRDELRGATMLKTRHFDGSPAPEVCARVVEVMGYSQSTRINK
jgi:hypothetical protein